MKFRSKALLMMCIVTGLAVSHSSLAQIPSLPRIGSGSSSTSSTAAPDSSISQDQLVQAYVAADYEILIGESKVAESLGLNDKAAELAAAAKALNSGGTQDSGALQKADKVIDDAKPLIEAALKNANLVDQAKVTYAQGLSHIGRGIQGTVKLKAAAIAFGQQAQAQIKSASMLQKMAVTQKLAAGSYVATHITDHITNVITALKLTVSFGRSHGVSIPDDAAAALTPV
jgi:hypothetical protein